VTDALIRRLLVTDARMRRHGGAVRYFVTLAAVAVLLFWIGYQALLVRYMFTALDMNDFGKFYYSARLFLDGADMYGPNPATSIPVAPDESRHFWNMNPPHLHLLMLPLALLRPAWALAAWWLLSLAALVTSLRVVARELGLRWTSRGLFWTAFWLTIFSPTSITLFTGQLGLLLMLPVTLAWRAARRDRWTTAALLIGAAASVKPFLLIFLPWLALRGDRTAPAMVSAALACFAAGLAVFGLDAHRAWLGALASMNWTWVPLNGSIAGLAGRTMARSPRFTPLVEAPALAWTLSVAAAAAIALTSLLAVARDRSPQAVDRAFAVLLLTALVVSPLGWIYYLFLAAGPLFALWRTLAARESPWRDRLILLAVPGLVWPVAMTSLWRLTPWGPLTFGSVYAWTMLALLGAVLLDGRAAERRRAA
jgi:hypothetical protein